MNLSDLEAATRSLSQLKAAERHLDAIKDFEVIGVRVTRSGSHMADGIRIERGGGTGTGSISCISYDDEMQAALTEALQQIFIKRVASAKAELQTLGIEVTS